MRHTPEAAGLGDDELGTRPVGGWVLIGADGQPFQSNQPGTLGGHRRTRLYGRLDCPSALAALARGGYKDHRVFFATAEDATAAGYRPCARCLPEAYKNWKEGNLL